MLKKLTLSTIVLSALLLNGCGGGGSKNSDPMNDKKHIIIFTEVQAGICESNDFKAYLGSAGFENYLVRETANNTSCATYGKKNDGNECAMEYTGGGNTNCVIGFDSINGQGSLKDTNAQLFDVSETIGNNL